MVRAALRNVFAHKARLLMTALAVTLGVAFVAGTLVFAGSITGAYAESSKKSFDHLDVRIRPVVGFGELGSGRLLGQETLDRARALPGVSAATGTASGFAALAGRDGALVGEGWQTQGANYPEAGGARYPLTDGRPPRSEREIAIDHRTAERTGYRVGDTVRLSVSGPVIEQRVSGVFTTDDGNVAAGGTLVLFDTATAQRLFAAPGRYNQIDLRAAPGTSPEALRRRAEAVLPNGTEAVTAAGLAAEQADVNAGGVRMLGQVLLACAGIALFVAAFLIVNTFTMLVAQRTRELALLRAVGASRRQVTLAVLAEAATVGLIASAAGLAIGIGAGAGVRGIVYTMDSTLPDGPLVVGAATVVAALAIGVGVTVFAAWLPARHAARIPPVAAMSSVHAPATTRGLVVRNAIGAALAASGFVLVVAATTMVDGKGWLGLGAVLLLTGVFVLTPLLSRPVIAAAGPVLRRFGVPGTLAGQNALRDPRRTAATASALTTGLTLITGLTVIGASAYRTTDALATANLRADYVVSMVGAGPLAADTERKLRGLDAVVASSPRREVQASVEGTNQTVVGLKASDVDELLDLGFIEGTFTAGETAIVDAPTATAKGWRLGDRIEVTWPDGVSAHLTITGLYDSSFDDGVKTDISTMDRHLDRVADTTVFVKTEGGASEATKRILREALGDSPAIRVQDRRDLVDDITGTVGIILNILYGMLAIAVVIAVLGVVNTLAMSVHERAREIGLLRAVGLDRSAVKRMIRLESIVISLFGGLLGVGLGVFFGWAVGELVTVLGISTWTLVLPWGRLALTLAAAALVGVVAALWPARRAAKLDVLEAIHAE
ncbi:ABC transporter permease [Phytohabitans aurantiacus]|uniref:ABC transporter n=1 Tax=Phytohabitans aurantiacus TaxID=3016789 RepID=A0ABQ5R5X0_9ACTN|nr:FtsX-like permease family protein [Phytohabitans aurantiacus]GLI01768.1 ABC transporter [Phytohabitans aurantiacus]